MAKTYRRLSNFIAREDAYADVSAWVIGELCEIVAGNLPIQAVSHPLGFVCLPVERSGPLGVCVHFWTPEAPCRADSATPQIHCHDWELDSFVLFGQLWNQQFQLHNPAQTLPGSSTSNSGQSYRLLDILSRDGTDELLPTNQIVTYSSEEPSLIRSGERYSVRAEDFHITCVDPEAEVVTVALGKTIEGARNQTLGPLDATARRVQRQLMTTTGTTKLTEAIIDRLRRASAGIVGAGTGY